MEQLKSQLFIGEAGKTALHYKAYERPESFAHLCSSRLLPSENVSISQETH